MPNGLIPELLTLVLLLLVIIWLGVRLVGAQRALAGRDAALAAETAARQRAIGRGHGSMRHWRPAARGC